MARAWGNGRTGAIGGALGTRLVILATVTLVLGPVLMQFVPEEVARWYLAAAREAELGGDSQRAEQYLSGALEWLPDRPTLLVARGRHRLAQKKYQAALQDAQRAIELSGGTLPDVFELRMLIFQRLGRHDEAIADADRLVQLVAEAPGMVLKTADGRLLTYPSVLNTRAYARALAGKQIEQGLSDIELAFSAAGNENNYAMLDTRGYLRYLAGDLQEALQDLQRAIELGEAEFQAVQGRLGQEPVFIEDPRKRARVERLFREELAVLYHHRGLVHRALGDDAQAEKDLQRADQYGYDPESGVW